MQLVRFQGQPGSLYYNYATSLGGNLYKERYGEAAIGVNPYDAEEKKQISELGDIARLMHEFGELGYARFVGEYPEDRRETLRQELRNPKADFCYSYQRPIFIHPFKHKLMDEFGKIGTQQVIDVLTDLRPEAKRAHLFSRYKKIHENDLYRAVSPEHWKEPIVQEQVLECLREMIGRCEGGFAGARKAKGNKLWLLLQ